MSSNTSFCSLAGDEAAAETENVTEENFWTVEDISERNRTQILLDILKTETFRKLLIGRRVSTAEKWELIGDEMSKLCQPIPSINREEFGSKCRSRFEDLYANYLEFKVRLKKEQKWVDPPEYFNEVSEVLYRTPIFEVNSKKKSKKKSKHSLSGSTSLPLPTALSSKDITSAETSTSLLEGFGDATQISRGSEITEAPGNKPALSLEVENNEEHSHNTPFRRNASSKYYLVILKSNFKSFVYI